MESLAFPELLRCNNLPKSQEQESNWQIKLLELPTLSHLKVVRVRERNQGGASRWGPAFFFRFLAGCAELEELAQQQHGPKQVLDLASGRFLQTAEAMLSHHTEPLAQPPPSPWW
eukprot:819728-Amphidinium_carterae.1